ncbi:MAG: primary-amine oxidase [Aestuariivirga sp.]
MSDQAQFLHPLDPLGSAEIARAAEVVRVHGGLSGQAWFETIALQEPEKADLARNESPPRRAFVCCYDPESGQTWDGAVNLAEGKLEGWHHADGFQARIVSEEFAMGGAVAKADPRVIAALALRGITDLKDVLIECWSAGNFGIAAEQGERIAYCHCFLRNKAGDNPYEKPIANLHPVVDLRRMKVVRVDDFGAVPLPPDGKRLRQEVLRTDLKPLEISQPDGPSFTVEGNLVRWQKWQLRVGFHVREGLILHMIGYEDEGKLRPIMHRASMAEMVVPYGDPRGGAFRRNAFDTGEYGVGQYLDSLTLGCDCLGHIHYFDAWHHDWHGKPKQIRNAICMHEEDYGILWKHTDPVRGTVTVRRSRRLVISAISNIGNYVYGFFWYFYQDGSIGVEIKATGIPHGTGARPEAPAEYGVRIAPGVEAHVHQHVFSFRFDMCVDGERNAVSEVNFAAVPMGEGNPHGNAIRIIENQLGSESQAQRNMDLATARYWRVINPNKFNGLGEPVAYKLVPGTNALPFNHPDSPVGRRAGFMYKHFWATQYAKGELYPAGWYPNLHEGGDGLPRWTEKDRSLDNENIVVWYTMNYHHLPRPEDWPVQPCIYASFHWMPSGFFDTNPALDVPSSTPKHCCD